MPHQTAAEDSDPVIASYPVYLTAPNAPSTKSPADTLPPDTQKLFLVQYPAYRPAETPYNARNLQKPTSLRLKPSTGLVEIDIPIDTKLNYNSVRGSAYATSLRRSRIAQEGGTHGLSGGFNAGLAGKNMRDDEEININTIPAYSDEPLLDTQTLGGKAVKKSPGGPIYLLGSFQNNSLHLSHLDAVVQVRPELHHLDAADELERNRGASAIARAKDRDGTIAGEVPAAARPTGQPGRPESKAIDIKLKSSGPLSSQQNDLGANSNANLLRTIQQEPWQTYQWIDEDDAESHERLRKALHLSMPPQDNADPSAPPPPPNLESAITNSEWLDLMSAPRIEHGRKGDKGLMAKVRGRERERQRRKRNEAARRNRATTAASKTGAAEEDDERKGGGVRWAAGVSVKEAGNSTAVGEPDGKNVVVDEEDTGDDEIRIGLDLSDEESSDDEAAPDEDDEEDKDEEVAVIAQQEVDMDMTDVPRLPGANDNDEVPRPNVVAVASSDGAADEPAPSSSKKKKGRPRKSHPPPSLSPPSDPIVISDD